eukprot:6191838-Pleurochrysis_carterae.AAC.1
MVETAAVLARCRKYVMLRMTASVRTYWRRPDHSANMHQLMPISKNVRRGVLCPSSGGGRDKTRTVPA